MKERLSEEARKANTSIKIDPGVWKEARIEAIKHDITVSQLLEEAVREWIDKKEKK